MTPTNPGDRNLERLLKDAYEPETPDPAFVAGLQQRLRATAQERALRHVGDARLGRLRTRLGWVFAVAAVAAGVGLVLYAQRPTAHREPGAGKLQPAATEQPIAGWLTPSAKPANSSAETLAVGATAGTQARQHKRLALPDNSVVFLNENSSVRLTANRRLTLESGEIFVAVSPNPAEQFVVQTPDRRVTALGTKFAVTARDGKTGVAVTQGEVQVSGLDAVLNAGQQLVPGGTEPKAAPQA